MFQLFAWEIFFVAPISQFRVGSVHSSMGDKSLFVFFQWVRHAHPVWWWTSSVRVKWGSFYLWCFFCILAEWSGPIYICPLYLSLQPWRILLYTINWRRISLWWHQSRRPFYLFVLCTTTNGQLKKRSLSLPRVDNSATNWVLILKQ